MLNALRCGVTIVSSVSLLLGAVPAYADDTAKTGIAAGLGLSAASGKTTLGDGAGAIEASLLDSDSMLQAGRAVRQIADNARTRYRNRQVLILDKDDQIDFSTALWVVKRMEDLNLAAGRLPVADCKNKPIIVSTRTVKSGPKKGGAGTGRMESLTTAPPRVLDDEHHIRLRAHRHRRSARNRCFGRERQARCRRSYADRRDPDGKQQSNVARRQECDLQLCQG